MSLYDRVKQNGGEAPGLSPRPPAPPSSPPPVASPPAAPVPPPTLPRPLTAAPGTPALAPRPASPLARPAPLAPPAGPETAPPAAAPPGQGGGGLFGRTTGAVRQAGGTRGAVSRHHDIRTAVRDQLIRDFRDRPVERSETDSVDAAAVEQKVRDLVDAICDEKRRTLSASEKREVVRAILNDVLGLGPLEDLLDDPGITEIMVNGVDRIYVERRGKLTRSEVVFESIEQLRQVVDRIVSRVGRRVDESSPMCDARLPDGSRVNVIIPPLALKGPTITIRKFAKDPITVENLIEFGSITREMVDFLQACVKARLNIIVSGGTGSGKTTTLNILSGFIPGDERIVTIEDAAELQLRQDHVVSLETRPANVEGRGAVHIRELVINALRMRPDRIVVGECRGGETLDMLQAMNTGHDGSLTTVHANTPYDCVNRLETLVLMSGMDLPVRAVREQIAAAIHIIVQQDRKRDGTRKVVHIAEVGRKLRDGEHVEVHDIFRWNQTGVDPDTGKVLGSLAPTGYIPACYEILEAEGEAPGLGLFTPPEGAEAEAEALSV